jgi:hypothetical protein
LYKEEKYVEGKDFSLGSGRIRIKQELRMATEGVAGPYYQSVELGLDQRGQGKYRRSEAFAGVVLLVPIAFSENRDARFIRLEK